MDSSQHSAELPPLSLLRIAVKSSDTTKLRAVLAEHPELLNYQDEKGATPLHWAAERQLLAVVSALLEHGADTTIKDRLGYTPVDTARWHGEYANGAYTEICEKIVDCLGKSERG
jgi:ankyrin repeat protein